MILRALTLAVFSFFSFANFGKADSEKISLDDCFKKCGILPKKCDKPEMLEFLRNFHPYFKKVTDKSFCFKTWHKALRLVYRDKALRLVYTEVDHMLLQKLIAILCLCKIIEEEIDSEEEYPRQIKFLKDTILSVLKVFERPENRNLLPEDWQQYLFSLWEKYLDCAGSVIIKKVYIRQGFLASQALRNILYVLWKQDFKDCPEPGHYNTLTYEQLKERVLGFLRYFEVGEDFKLVSESGEDLRFYLYCKLLRPEILDWLIFKLNEDITDWVVKVVLI